MKTLRLAVVGTHAAPQDECSSTFSALDYSADMLQRTMRSPTCGDRVDYLVVERIARDLRNQYVASLVGRTKRALARRFARGARNSLGGTR